MTAYSVVANSVDTVTKDEYNKLFTTIVLVWGVMDTVTTYIGIALHKTIEHEINPLVRGLFEVHPLYFLVVKTVTITIVVVAAIYGKTHIRDVLLWKHYLSSVVLLGFCVIALNTFSIIVGIRLYI